MHILEVALFAQFDAFERNHHRECGGPLPKQSLPRRSSTAVAARAAVTIGIVVLVAAVAVAG